MAYLQQNDAGTIRHSIEGGRITIGRQDTNDIVLPGDMRVSRHHAEIEELAGEWVLRDLRSRNGSILNGKRVTKGPLREGDRIKIVAATFVFSAENNPMATIADTRVHELGTNADLSARETDVLGLLCRGSTDQQIAEELVISLATVRSHLDRIRDKTGCRRRPESTCSAIELGLDSRPL